MNFLNIKSNHARSTKWFVNSWQLKHCWLKLSISVPCYPITMQLLIQWFLANKLPGTWLQRCNLKWLQLGIHNFFPEDLKLFYLWIHLLLPCMWKWEAHMVLAPHLSQHNEHLNPFCLTGDSGNTHILRATIHTTKES